ncbi:MAG TPA: Holliday junction branch migration protein RuvA [Nevskiaceae bacterium]
MIGRLTGIILSKQPPWLELGVGGVGYEIEAPMSTFYRLPETDATTTLYTHLVVRQDAQLLYGFSQVAEKALFRALLKVSGVGPKVALAVLSSVSVDEFRSAVRAGDSARLTRTPGVGKKTAERIIVELRDRLPGGNAALGKALRPDIAATPRDEACAALESLGYKPAEARRLVEAVAVEDVSTDVIIREALRRAAR